MGDREMGRTRPTGNIVPLCQLAHSLEIRQTTQLFIYMLYLQTDFIVMKSIYQLCCIFNIANIKINVLVEISGEVENYALALKVVLTKLIIYYITGWK